MKKHFEKFRTQGPQREKWGACFFLFLFMAIIYSSCFPPPVGPINGTFYYGTNERISLGVVRDKLIVKLTDSAGQNLLTRQMANLGQLEHLGESVFSITLKQGIKPEKMLNDLKKQDDVLSANFLYRTKDGQDMGVTDAICVEFKRGITEEQRKELMKQMKVFVKPPTRPGNPYFTMLTVSKDQDVLAVANRIHESGLVKFSHPDFLVTFRHHAYIPADPLFERQFYLNNTGQEIADGHRGRADADIDAPEAWEITRGSASITVAVLDEGVERSNNDLPAARLTVLPGSNFAPGDPNDPSPVGNGAHGTACAGIIGAQQDNTEGVSGIAPLCRIMPIRLPLGTAAPVSAYANAINFAWSNGADVLSNSWGGSSSAEIPVITAAISNANTMGRGGRGAVVVFAAGNTANHVAGNTGFVTFPGTAPVPDMLVAGASDRNDEQANYSPDGSLIDVVAPSHKAYASQIPTECFEVWTTDILNDNGYNFNGGPCPDVFDDLPSMGINFRNYTARMGGTSAACPQVAAAAALLLSVNPALTPAQVHIAITSSADKIGGYTYTGGRSVETGFGRLNLFNLLSANLWSKDRPNDPGTEPNTTSTPIYASEDIWVRKTADGSTTHENAEFRDPSTGRPNAVYVKIRNAGALPGTATVRLYWAKASSGLAWPAPWDGSVTSPAIMGAPIGSAPVSLGAFGETTLQFNWFPPNPSDYAVFGPDQTHFCLLARIETSSSAPFGMTFPETGNLGTNVANNNNIVWKNITVRDDAMGALSSAGLLIANYDTRAERSRLRFTAPGTENYLRRYGKLTITLSEPLFKRWQSEQGRATGLKQEGRTFTLTADSASLGDFTLQPGDIYGIHVSYRMNGKGQFPKDFAFPFDVEQLVVEGSSIKVKGGERYQFYPYKQ